MSSIMTAASITREIVTPTQLQTIEASSYVYSPLDRTSDEVRLARFAAVDKNNIRIELQTYPLASAPKFLALSYEWGPLKDCRRIFVDDEPFFVRQNLWDGLQALWNSWTVEDRDGTPRIDDADDFFWVDALCIDQQNVPERSHQVNIMAKLYSLADLVVVWLGPALHESDKAISYISYPPSGVPIRPQFPYATSKLLSSMTPPPSKLSIRSVFKADVATAIISFYQRPYWTRLWVVQEILLARNLIILCGNRSLSWEKLKSFSLTFGANRDLELTRTRAYDIIADHLSRKKKFQLGHVLTRYGSQNCADPRDRIFGLLSLIDFQDRSPLMADYSLSTEELCDLVSKHIASIPYLKWHAELILNLHDACRTILGLGARDPGFCSYLLLQKDVTWKEEQRLWMEKNLAKLGMAVSYNVNIP
jgi:hypothetical protein